MQEIKCVLSRNGVFCRHKMMCSTREAVQRSMLKALLCLEETHVEGVSLERAMYYWDITKRNDKLRDALQKKMA